MKRAPWWGYLVMSALWLSGAVAGYFWGLASDNGRVIAAQQERCVNIHLLVSDTSLVVCVDKDGKWTVK